MREESDDIEDVDGCRDYLFFSGMQLAATQIVFELSCCSENKRILSKVLQAVVRSIFELTGQTIIG